MIRYIGYTHCTFQKLGNSIYIQICFCSSEQKLKHRAACAPVSYIHLVSKIQYPKESVQPRYFK